MVQLMLLNQHFFFNIDVVGSCNLRCPSCPVGNSPDIQNPNGFMEPSLLDSIMNKAISECNVAGVGLFNWAEPVLHPQLPELIKIVQSYKVPCHISSNLNILKNVDEILSANPSSFRISNSGFTQNIYSSTHRGGNIERVKNNMIKLAESKKKVGSTTSIHVLYHRYLTNLHEESMMRKFAHQLGFEFIPVWAFMMPLEKILSYAENISDMNNSNLTDEDIQTIQKLALPLKESFEVSARYKHINCSLRDNQMTIDFQGNVQLCCAVFDSQKFKIGSFLDMNLPQLQSLKYSEESEKTCSKCMNHGIHIYSTYGTKDLNRVAIFNVMNNDLLMGLRLYITEILFDSKPLNDFISLSVRLVRKIRRSMNKS